MYLWDGLCGMYMMTGESPGMYYYNVVFSVFPHYIIIINVVQGCSFGATSNHRLQGIISLKVPEHDEECKQLRETYLVVAVCG